jgi:hypothetical protein
LASAWQRDRIVERAGPAVIRHQGQNSYDGLSGIGPRRNGGPLCCQRRASSGFVIQR